jgi:hypothetical protein
MFRSKKYKHRPRILKGYITFPYYIIKEDNTPLSREERISNTLVDLNRSLYYSRAHENAGYLIKGLLGRYKQIVMILRENDFADLLDTIQPSSQYYPCNVMVYLHFQKLIKKYKTNSFKTV